MFVLSIFGFIIVFINGYFSNRVKIYIEETSKLNASIAFEEIVRNDVIKTIDTMDLITVDKSNDNNYSVIVNTNQVNVLLAKTSKRVNELMLSLDTIESLNNLKLPIGIIFSDILFTKGKLNIDINILPIGSAIVDVVSDIKEYGINNSLFTMDIIINFSFKTIMPFNSSLVNVDMKIPIIVQTINGVVPRYYSYGNNSIPFVTSN